MVTGVQQLAQKIAGLTAREFGNNLRLQFERYVLKDPQNFNLDQAAGDLINSQFPTQAAVLAEVRYGS